MAGVHPSTAGKLSGHAAEYRLAVLFASLGLPFAPKEKAENPLCRDAQVDGMSFDLVAPGLDRPRLLVMSTMHTANIGQYGQSKTSGDTSKARRWIDETYDGKHKPTLLAFADGIGFRSNRQDLDGVLTHADEFCQFKTIWKAVVIAARLLDHPLQIALPVETMQEFSLFIDRWTARDLVLPSDRLDSTEGWLEAGDGLVTRKD